MRYSAIRNGFTLIELLVVIAIIGILAAAVLASLDDARAAARNATRKQELESLRIALELHYQKHGSYTQPETLCTDTSFGALGSCGGAGGEGGWDANSDLNRLITDGVMKELPLDPLNTATYHYSYEPSNPGEHGYGSGGVA